jgi:hypothetical protein
MLLHICLISPPAGLRAEVVLPLPTTGAAALVLASHPPLIDRPTLLARLATTQTTVTNVRRRPRRRPVPTRGGTTIGRVRAAGKVVLFVAFLYNFSLHGF